MPEPTTEPNPFAALLSGVKAQLHDRDPGAFHGDSGPGDCPRCAGPVPAPPSAPEPSTCTCAGTRAGLNACVHCPTPWPDFPGAIRMTRPEDVAAGVAPAFARSAPSCIWPDCLTDAQQVELADQVGAAMGGEATTPMPDQRQVCGCREPAVDLGPAELTAEEARALAEELGQDLYEAQDALSFVAECCDIADRTGEPVTTARVREWLEGAKCGRQIMAERGRSVVDVAAKSDIGTEFVRQADNPDWDALANVHPTSEPYAYQPPPAFTWAESVATTGTGPTAQIDIDIHAPGQAEPVPVKIPLDVARTLHAMLGDLLSEHDEAEPDSPTNEDLRLRVFGIALDNLIRFKGSSLHPSTVAVDISDAVLAVRDGEMQQLQDQLAQVEDLLRIAHDTSNRSEAERAQAVRRAETAEAEVAAAQSARDSAAASAATLLAGVVRVRAIEYADGQDDGWDRALDAVYAALAEPAGQGDGGGK